MAEFTSEIKDIPFSDSQIFDVLSDLNNLALVKGLIPGDKVKEFSFDKDSCTINVDPVGNVRFVVVERDMNKTIKFEAQQVPFGVNMWIQLKEVSSNETKMKLTIKADLNPFIKPMVSKPLQEGINKVADVLANLDYEKIGSQGKVEE